VHINKLVVFVTIASYEVRKEKSCDYSNPEKGAFLAASIADYPFHCHALATFLQLPAANFYRHPFLLLVPTSMDNHHGHYHGYSLLRR
jgi:hypothetical protein